RKENEDPTEIQSNSEMQPGKCSTLPALLLSRDDAEAVRLLASRCARHVGGASTATALLGHFAPAAALSGRGGGGCPGFDDALGGELAAADELFREVAAVHGLGD